MGINTCREVCLAAFGITDGGGIEFRSVSRLPIYIRAKLFKDIHKFEFTTVEYLGKQYDLFHDITCSIIYTICYAKESQ